MAEWYFMYTNSNIRSNSQEVIHHFQERRENARSFFFWPNLIDKCKAQKHYPTYDLEQSHRFAQNQH